MQSSQFVLPAQETRVAGEIDQKARRSQAPQEGSQVGMFGPVVEGDDGILRPRIARVTLEFEPEPWLLRSLERFANPGDQRTKIGFFRFKVRGLGFLTVLS